jgi:nicotinate-nucleotide adenylyltransferase
VTGFRDRLGADARLVWIIGADSLAELASWYRISDLVDSCEIVTVARPGWERPDLSGLKACLSDAQIDRLVDGVLDSPLMDISSTDMRRRVAAGESIDQLTPRSVVDYIEAQQLYR